ncbi:hypothetical protein GCM10010399_34790 [Dactylosporangium fulvum]
MKQSHYLGRLPIALDVRRGVETADFPVTRRRARWTGSERDRRPSHRLSGWRPARWITVYVEAAFLTAAGELA